MAASWTPNSVSNSCGSCHKEFGLVVRRHHCRACGKQFCERCSHKKLPIPLAYMVRKPGEHIKASEEAVGAAKSVRVCLPCWEVHKNGFQSDAATPIFTATSPASHARFISSPGYIPSQDTGQDDHSQHAMHHEAVEGRRGEKTEPHPEFIQPGATASPHPYQTNISPSTNTLTANSTAQTSTTRTPDPNIFSAFSPLHSHSPSPTPPQNSIHTSIQAGEGTEIAMPPGEYFTGPPVPQNPGPLPLFHGKNDASPDLQLRMDDMVSKLTELMKTRGKEDAHSTSLFHGMMHTSLIETLQILQERHIPDGIEAGFVAQQTPVEGTLARRAGFQQYDFIYGYEDNLVTKSTKPLDFASDMRRAFEQKGSFVVLVYSFRNRTYRRVTIPAPAGRATAILGLVTSKLPLSVEMAPTGFLSSNDSSSSPTRLSPTHSNSSTPPPPPTSTTADEIPLADRLKELQKLTEERVKERILQAQVLASPYHHQVENSSTGFPTTTSSHVQHTEPTIIITSSSSTTSTSSSSSSSSSTTTSHPSSH